MAASAAEEVAAGKPTWSLRTPPAGPLQSAASSLLLLLLLQVALLCRYLMRGLLKRLPLLVLTALLQLLSFLFLVSERQWKLEGPHVKMPSLV
mmetsp:Transcript_13710/g.41416  ORF Transcript_13710/g.41416 Transcript_13710/m.41416 type:complete len:93 (-) Transcript_13710:1874-2152(-)